MTMPALFAFLHHVAAFALVAALAVEFVLIREEIKLQAARRLLLAALVFGPAAARAQVRHGGSPLGLVGGQRPGGRLAARLFLRERPALLPPQRALHRQGLAL